MDITDVAPQSEEVVDDNTYNKMEDISMIDMLKITFGTNEVIIQIKTIDLL